MINSIEWLSHPGSVGRAVIGELRIVDDYSGELIPSGQAGSVHFANGRPFA